MASTESRKLLVEVASYYTGKLAEFGATAKGVDWNSDLSQMTRFEQITKVVTARENFSLNDLGCGYGALLDYLYKHYQNFYYTGCDVSSNMIATAQQRNRETSRVRFCSGSEPPDIADYGVASGIFHVRLSSSISEWRVYLENTLDTLNRTSRRGFSFNCLTSYSDADKMRDDLYYADPCAVFDHCKRRFSRHIALLHDYGLYEFTIVVRKDL